MRSLTLYIPLYDAAEYLESSIRTLEDFFVSSDILTEVVFIDDGSRDLTGEILRNKLSGVNFPYQIMTLEMNTGKGAALRQGLKKIPSHAEFVAFTDGELPYGLESLVVAINLAVKNKADMVAGERVSKSEQYTKYRRIASGLFRFFLPWKLRLVNDTQCGLKLFRRDVAEKIFSRLNTSRWVFDVEVFLLALENDLKVARMPVNIRPELVRNGRLRFFLHGFQILIDLFRIRYYEKKGNYKIT